MTIRSFSSQFCADHYEAAAPPRANCDEGLRGSYCEWRDERDDRGKNGRQYTVMKRRERSESKPYGRGWGPGDGRDSRFAQPFLCRAETLPCECLDELFLVLARWTTKRSASSSLRMFFEDSVQKRPCPRKITALTNQNLPELCHRGIHSMTR